MEKKKIRSFNRSSHFINERWKMFVIQLWGRTWPYCMFREPSNGGKARAIILVYTEKRKMSCSECTDDCSMHIKFDALTRDWKMQGRVR